jgi:hypothetical protein
MVYNFTICRIKILLAIILLASSSGCGSVTPVVEMVKDFIVTITSEVGKVVSEKSSTLAAALNAAWEKVFPNLDPKDPAIRITSPDGLKGVCTIKLRQKITGGGKTEVTMDLSPPFPVQRKTVNDPWNPSPENYPL